MTRPPRPRGTHREKGLVELPRPLAGRGGAGSEPVRCGPSHPALPGGWGAIRELWREEESSSAGLPCPSCYARMPATCRNPCYFCRSPGASQVLAAMCQLPLFLSGCGQAQRRLLLGPWLTPDRGDSALFLLLAPCALIAPADSAATARVWLKLWTTQAALAR